MLTLFVAELLGGNRFATINHCSHKMVFHINMRFELKTDKMNLDPIISFGLRKTSVPVWILTGSSLLSTLFTLLRQLQNHNENVHFHSRYLLYLFKVQLLLYRLWNSRFVSIDAKQNSLNIKEKYNSNNNSQYAEVFYNHGQHTALESDDRLYKVGHRAVSRN